MVEELNIKGNYDQDYKIVLEARKKLLKENGIIILVPMTKSRRRKINNIINEFDDISSFSIGEKEERRVLIRRVKKNLFLNHKELMDEANKAYDEHNYDKCIENNLLVLNTLGYTHSNLYMRLGFAYLKNKNVEKAIDYLTVADLMDNKHSFDDIIYNLKNKIKVEKEDQKKYTYVELSEFENTNYLDNNFEKINTYCINNNLDVESVCEIFNLNENEIALIKLEYAKYYYIIEEYERGDIFLNDVIKMKNKSKLIKDTIEDINNNKRFYKNREINIVKELKYPKIRK